MLSSDREILIAINDRLIRIEDRVSVLENTVAEMRRDNDYRFLRLEDRIDTLQTSVYWIFAAIGIFIAFISIVPFKNTEPARRESNSLSFSDIRELIRLELSAHKNRLE